MKSICKTLILLLLVLSLVLALVACTSEQDTAKEDGSWITDEAQKKTDGSTAYRQEFNSSDSDAATQSTEKVKLPTIP